MTNKRRIYLDHAATSPVLEECLDEMIRTARECYANPSSIHAPGKAAKKKLEDYRRGFMNGLFRICNQVDENEGREDGGRATGAEEDAWEVVFTSGGTESNVSAWAGVLAAGKKGHIVTSAIEHPSILECGKNAALMGGEMVLVPPDRSGRVDPARFMEKIDRNVVMVSMMAVNNETGIVQPAAEVFLELKKRFPRIVLHSDAVQALGNVSLREIMSVADLITLSAHKIGGPRGCGALLHRRGVPFQPLLCGGGQENKMRSGTENLPAVGGFVKALELLADWGGLRMGRVRSARTMMRDLLLSSANAHGIDVRINEDQDNQSPHILSVSVRDVPSEALTRALSERSVDASPGSACLSSGTKQSHVLQSMGVPPNWSTIRFSFSLAVSTEDVQYAGDAWLDCVRELML